MPVTQCSENKNLAKPRWLRRDLSYTKEFFGVKELLKQLNLNTVCREATCPNISECWSKKHATLIILGKNCTRNCLFCDVGNNKPDNLDEEEPKRVAEAVKQLKLEYVTITSVTRDDLADSGTKHFINTVKAIKNNCSDVIVELLIPDLGGEEKNIEEISNSGADVIGHNIETVSRLYEEIRLQANYKKSLRILELIKEKNKDILTKSAIMVGLGESYSEIVKTLKDLKRVGVDIVYIGQYLRPSMKNIEVLKFYTPEQFKKIANIAKHLGFEAVMSGPFVRSSYKANESYGVLKQ